MNKYTLTPLQWDSEFLGYSVAKLTTRRLEPADLVEVLVVCQEKQIKLLYLFVSPDNEDVSAVAKAYGGKLMDRKVTYSMPLSPDGTTIDEHIISCTTYSVQLESLAWQSGEYSRFRLDKNFAPWVYKELYSRWLHNSLSGQLARQVLVYRSDTDVELGLLTLGEKDGRADIGLLAVDATARGQRLGQQLIAAACHQARDWGHKELQVVTQRDNQLACRFYERCGFHLDSEEHIYHLWVS